jgi:phosphatidylinositol alpha-1,6-mannosyltransferase
MRIGIVAPEFPPDIGGVETYAFEFSKELAKRGHDVTVFTPRHARGEVSVPGGRVHAKLSMRRDVDQQILGDYPVDVWHVMNAAFAWLALEGKPTVVSVHGNDFLRPYISVAKRSWASLPLLWRLADMGNPNLLESFWTWRTRRLMNEALPKAKHILANSQYTEAALLDRYPACRGKTSVAFVGVGERFFSVEHRPAANGVRRLLTVSRLSERRKNVDMVLQALASLKERYAFSYTVVGDGHDRARLELLTKELGLQDRVRFTGFVGQDDLLRIYSESDLFVLTSSILPSSHEGFGIVYLEAAASGVPSLAARLAGAAEAVSDGVSGMFVDAPAVGTIAGALSEFLDGKIKFDREACRQFAQQFSWRRVVDHSLSFYA